MKKWIVYVLIGFTTAGSASAAFWPFGSKEEPKELPPAEAMERPMREHQGSPGAQRKRSQMSEVQRAEMKANRDAIHQLAEAARNETDPVEKEVLVDQLRVKLTEGAEKMQAEFRKRLEKAEGDVAKMRQRLDEGEQNMEQRVEEHLQALLSGEKPLRREGKRPNDAPRKKHAPAVE
ncbi:MAG: hypothetical protein JEZ10_02550 [Verrucomicrobia bacterium]|nr:hypothetical protein [Verrucomicrobiota bacterium]